MRSNAACPVSNREAFCVGSWNESPPWHAFCPRFHEDIGRKWVPGLVAVEVRGQPLVLPCSCVMVGGLVALNSFLRDGIEAMGILGARNEAIDLTAATKSRH